MAYIKRVRDTANQNFDLHDARLGEGAELNIVKDWAVNDTQSSKYIANRTHYTDNRFELINPNWSEGELPGKFASDNAPQVIELENDYVLYKLSNTVITSQEILDNLLDKCIVYYKPYNSVVNIGTFATVFNTWSRGYATTGNYGQHTTEVTVNANKNNNTVIYKMYYVYDNDSFILQNTQLNLTKGLYALSLKDLSTQPYILRVLKGPDQDIKLDIKYIPDSLIETIATIENSYATTTYVDTAIQSVTGQIPDISVKMDKVNPEGNGDFKLLKTTGNIPSNIYVTGNVYSNYDPNDVTAQKKLATEEYVTNGLATKMDATKRIFDSLFIGTAQNNSRVLTTDDIPTISGKIFRGIYADSSYLPTGVGYVDEGDYAYVLTQYTNGSSATIIKYVYTSGTWTSSGTFATDTFTPTQWTNINEASSLINTLQNTITALELRVAELEEQCEAMFEWAEGQEF